MKVLFPICVSLLLSAISVVIAAGPSGKEGSKSSQDATLYNGICLSSPWPPKVQSLTREPMSVPYLESPPELIPIDVGRQLFFDDFLIEQTTLKRTFHKAKYYSDNPILKPDKPWEQEGENPTAMVFSDGVWYDSQDHLFKMWYMGGYVHSTCYAISEDGIHWEKPVLDVVPETNIVHTSRRDSGTVWLDHRTKDPKQRYKMFLYDFQGGLSIHFSADGIHWSEVTRSGPCGDRTTVFYNPFRNVWVYSLRANAKGLGRIRRYWENPDVIAASQWKEGEPPLWVGADSLDPRRDDLKIQPQLYNLDAVAYESVLLGLFTIWRGQPSDRAKPNEVVLGFSRNGFHWYRPERSAFIPVSEHYGDWNWANVQSAGGGCLIVSDKLYFYVSGRAGVPGSKASGVCSTGLATLRRDGFASMDAGKSGGILITRPVRFSGKHLFVNVDADAGELRVEILDKHGEIIAPFSRANCIPIRADKTLKEVRWKDKDDLSMLVERPVKFRFYLRKARIYAFWVSSKPSGASHGYVAAGGPGFTGTKDTVGSMGYWR